MQCSSCRLLQYKNRLMVEQTDTCEGHSHAVLVTALDDSVVSDGSARLCDVLDAALLRALDVIGEWEESIGAESDVIFISR